MREFKKRRTKQEELFYFVLKVAGTLLLLLVTFFLMRAAWGMYTKMSNASHAEEEAKKQLVLAQAEHKGVSATLTTITSTRGVEQQIRERYGVVKPGEGEIDVIRDTKTPTTTPVVQDSWWQHVFRALFVWQ